MVLMKMMAMQTHYKCSKSYNHHKRGNDLQRGIAAHHPVVQFRNRKLGCLLPQGQAGERHANQNRGLVELAAAIVPPLT